jgi:hypothetical protein
MQRLFKLAVVVALVVIATAVAAQRPAGLPSPYSRGWQRYGYTQADSGVIHAERDTAWTPRFRWTEVVFEKTSYWYDGTRWLAKGGAGGGNFPYNGRRPITRDIQGLSGFTPNTDSVIQFLDALFYPSQAPTSGLTITHNGVTASVITLEMMNNWPDMAATLNWTATRRATTPDLTSVVVAGENMSFSPPIAGASVSGTKSVTLNRNTLNTFTATVTASDGKTSSATATVNFLWKRYYGFVTDPTPTDDEIHALTSEWATTRAVNHGNNPVNPGGSKYFLIGFPESLDPGGVSKVWVGGLDQTGTFNRIVRSFTNASGAITNYIFLITKNPTSGSVAFSIE